MLRHRIHRREERHRARDGLVRQPRYGVGRARLDGGLREDLVERHFAGGAAARVWRGVGVRVGVVAGAAAVVLAVGVGVDDDGARGFSEGGGGGLGFGVCAAGGGCGWCCRGRRGLRGRRVGGVLGESGFLAVRDLPGGDLVVVDGGDAAREEGFAAAAGFEAVEEEEGAEEEEEADGGEDAA